MESDTAKSGLGFLRAGLASLASAVAQAETANRAQIRASMARHAAQETARQARAGADSGAQGGAPAPADGEVGAPAGAQSVGACRHGAGAAPGAVGGPCRRPLAIARGVRSPRPRGRARAPRSFKPRPAAGVVLGTRSRGRPWRWRATERQGRGWGEMERAGRSRRDVSCCQQGECTVGTWVGATAGRGGGGGRVQRQ